MFAATGTGAMEGAVANTLSAGDTALVVDGGKFGERWTELCKVYGVKAERLAVEWGHAVDVKAVAKLPGRQPRHQGGLCPGQRDLHRRAAPGAGTGGGDQEAARHHPGGGRHLRPGGLCPAHG